MAKLSEDFMQDRSIEIKSSGSHSKQIEYIKIKGVDITNMVRGFKVTAGLDDNIELELKLIGNLSVELDGIIPIYLKMAAWNFSITRNNVIYGAVSLGVKIRSYWRWLTKKDDND